MWRPNHCTAYVVADRATTNQKIPIIRVHSFNNSTTSDHMMNCTTRHTCSSFLVFILWFLSSSQFSPAEHEHEWKISSTLHTVFPVPRTRRSFIYGTAIDSSTSSTACGIESSGGSCSECMHGSAWWRGVLVLCYLRVHILYVATRQGGSLLLTTLAYKGNITNKWRSECTGGGGER